MRVLDCLLIRAAVFLDFEPIFLWINAQIQPKQLTPRDPDYIISVSAEAEIWTQKCFDDVI